MPSGVASSLAYMTDDITWCFSRPNPVLLWSDLFSLLTLELWMTEIFIVFINGLVLFHVLRLDNYLRDWIFCIMMSFYLQIGGPTYYNPRESIIRCIYGINLFVGFIWNSIFCALWLGTLQKIFTEIRFKDLLATKGLQYVYRGTENTVKFLDQVLKLRNKNCQTKLLIP